MIGQTVSHYKILELLGGGGMGIVYKAQDLKLDRAVALKFLPPELTRDRQARARFIHEAKAASALQHNNICTIHDVDATSDGALFIVMDLYDGETLEEKTNRGSLQISEAIDLAVQIAQGLSDAHRAGILHRDIKPANIFVTKSGVVKILDFGLAKLSGRTLLTKTGSTIGTAAYMSPEQARGEELDERTDIWSFGVVLYQMLIGQRPFKAEHENALIYAILNVDPNPPSLLRPEVPSGVERVVMKCLARSPEDRYKCMDDLVADLRSDPREGAESRPQREPHPGPASQRTQRRVLWYGMTASGVLAVSILGYILIWSGREAKPPAAHRKMIAVLPFENLGPTEDEYFADGLTDEITSRLSAIRGLGVISRTSSMQYKKTQKTLPVVARELGVEYVLEGTIRWVKTGPHQRLRITPQLIQVSDDRHLWADNIDRTLDDVFSVQTEIATRVVDALGIVLRESEKGAVEAVPTRSLDAYQAYLRGNAAAKILDDRNSVRTAIEMYERAVTLDSTFAMAYVALAYAHLGYYWWGHDRTPERITLAKEALDRAFALQPDLPQAYGALCYYYYWGFRDYEKALQALQRAEEVLPNESMVFATRAYILKRQGKFQEALEDIKKAFTLDPKAPSFAIQISTIQIHLGLYAEAETYLDRAIAIRPEDNLPYLNKADMYLRWNGDTKKSRNILELLPATKFPWEQIIRLDIYDRNYRKALERLAHVPEAMFVNLKTVTPISQVRGLVYRFMGDTAKSRIAFDAARVSLESALNKNPKDYRFHMSLGITLAGLGRKPDAIRAARRAAEIMSLSVDAVDGAYPLVTLAQVNILLGDHESAIDQIASLLGLPAPKLLTVPLLRMDPVYDPLRTYPRFQALLATSEQM